MARVDTSAFRPLTFEYEKIHISGGHSTKSLPMISKTVKVHGTAAKGTAAKDTEVEKMTFVKLAVSELWLIASTTGQTKYAGSSFGRTSLLDVLRDEIQKH